MRLGKEVQLAINLLARLGDNPQSSIELSNGLGVDYRVVQKVANKLRRADLCNAMRGWGGGLYRKRSVQVSEIIQVMQKQERSIGRSLDVQEQIEFLLQNIWI